MAKKRVVRRAVRKNVRNATDSSSVVSRSKFVLVARNLFLFLALAILFYLFKGLSTQAVFVTLFQFLFIICLGLFIALVIAFFVLLVLKYWRK